MTERYYFTDSASGTLEYTGSTVTVDSFDVDNAETVTIDSHWNDFFDTDEYFTFDATVAQPIVQPTSRTGSFSDSRRAKMN